MSSQASLSAAAEERKARLAKLQSLKRKQPDEDQDMENGAPSDVPQTSDVTLNYFSGRNFDATTKGPKLGFELNPAEGQNTLEKQARELEERTRKEAEKEGDDKPLDLFKLQPKKPNWDLKRDLEKKLEVLNVRTENAIARLVRERIEKTQGEAKTRATGRDGTSSGDGQEVGMEGVNLVEAMHVREREEEAEREREKDDDELA
ncbi:cell cycle control protein Cwf18 [Phyllosticta citriasiana]|uniref:cell cycle control protein Cwf18 n=1 Tax=Phyllosticta citriasiana TaxID=595635 RepID=UPI0030FD5494